MSKNQINVGFNASENIKPPKNCACINGLKVSTNRTQRNIELTNNKAEYFSELAEEYKNMAEEFMEQSKYYAENNADITVEQFEALEESLENYALKSDLPTKVSELQNDLHYIKESEMEEALGELDVLPPRDNCENMYLKTDGTDVFWASAAGGLEVGDIAFTQGTIDETKGLRRALNGSVVTQNSNTQGFFDWFTTSVTQNPDIATTEAEWQSENTTNGMCGKFVYTAESTTNYHAYTSGETTYFTTSTDDSESVNVYNSEFELQGTGSISSGVLTYNTQTYNRASGSDDSVTNPATLRIPNYPKYFIGNVTSGTVPVVGNGKSLGLTNGTANAGLFMSQSSGLNANLVSYGVNIPAKATSGSTSLSTNDILGVTTDSDKSGLESNIPDPYKIAGTYFIQIATSQETEVNITNEIVLNNPFFFGMYQYFDSKPNNLSWLRSAGQWNSKAVYPDYYNWLLGEKNNPETLPADTANVEFVGNVSNTNGVLGGFGDNIYAQINSVPASVTSFEMVFKVTTGDSVTGMEEDQIITGQASNYTSPQFGLDSNGNGYFTFGIGASATEWGTGIGSLEVALPNTTYWFKGTWDGTTVSFYLKTSEEAEWVLQSTASQSTIDWSQPMIIGNDYNAGGMVKPWLGTIDLNECYININGSRWWTGMSNNVKFSTEDYNDYDYVINTTDETFRLPIKTISASGKAVVGNGKVLGWTNGKGNYDGSRYDPGSGLVFRTSAYGTMLPSTQEATTTSFSEGDNVGITTDPENSGLELSDGDLYLYYYVGETVQNANLIDAGRIAEQFSEVNSRPYITETYQNGASGYRVWSYGFCEQWGYVEANSANGNRTVNLLKNFANTSYYLSKILYGKNNTTTTALRVLGYQAKNVDSFEFYDPNSTYANGYDWYACGYIG